MTRDKKTKLNLPSLVEDDDFKDNLFDSTSLKNNKENPASLLLELSNIISFKLLQASINQNTQIDKICAIILNSS